MKYIHKQRTALNVLPDFAGNSEVKGLYRMSG